MKEITSIKYKTSVSKLLKKLVCLLPQNLVLFSFLAHFIGDLMLFHYFAYPSLFFITHIWSWEISLTWPSKYIQNPAPSLTSLLPYWSKPPPSFSPGLLPRPPNHSLCFCLCSFKSDLNVQGKAMFWNVSHSVSNSTENPQWLPIKAKVLTVASKTLQDLHPCSHFCSFCSYHDDLLATSWVSQILTSEPLL